jgi:tight adherence protein B
MHAMFGPILTAILIALAVLSFFIAFRRFMPQGDPLEARLREYGLSDYVRLGNPKEAPQAPQRFALVNRMLHGFGLGEKLAHALMRADVPLTAAEFAVAMFVLGTGGFIVGSWRVNGGVGVVLGILFAIAPLFYLKFAEGRRRSKFIAQLPDLLTLLVGSLRAGYGLSQAIDLVAHEVPPPAGKEFAIVMRAVGLGVPLQRALDAMAERIGSDDLDLMVTAINVQYEMGGNLSTVLETISETIRERVRVLREVQVLTAQQRLTGTILAFIPVGLSIGLAIARPGYFDPFFEPGLVRILPIMAIGMMVMGFGLIQMIVNIKV